jgi:glycosyltransferase involved in cell wall biosynthesis
MRVSASALHAGWNNAQRFRALRQAIRDVDADLVVSVTDQMNVLTLLATQGLHTRVVIAEHSDPRHQQMNDIWERLRRWTYPWCSAAVVLTESVARQMRAMISERPVYVIPNGIRQPSVTIDNVGARHPNQVVAIGRLSPEKGFDQLIDAFAPLARLHPDWNLAIAGEGPEQPALQQQIDQLRLSEQIRLVGWVRDPEEFLARGSLFVMSSRYEGFPVALLEAMAVGLPVVSFDCDSGPREIIRPDVDGLLVPAGDVSALTDAIDQLQHDAPLRQRLGRAAREVTQRFSQDQFRQRWNAVVDACLC